MCRKGPHLRTASGYSPNSTRRTRPDSDSVEDPVVNHKYAYRQSHTQRPRCICICSVLFFSRPRSEGWPHLIDSSTESPVHVLMLSIQVVRGLPRQRASGIVRCIIQATPLFLHNVTIVCQLPCFDSVYSSYLYSSFVKNPLICFLCCSRNPQNLSQSFHLKGVKTSRFFILSRSPAFTAVCCYRPH